MISDPWIRLVCKLTLSLLAVGAVLAQDTPAKAPAGQDLGRARQRLQELQGQLSQLDGQLNMLRRRRQGILVELQGITLRASKARTQTEVARMKQEQIQSELQRLNRRKTEINKELDRLKTGLRSQVRWLQALGPLGTLSFFPNYSDVESYLARSRYLEWWRGNENRKLQKTIDLHSELIEREKEITETEAQLTKTVAESAVLQEELRANERRLQEYLDGLQKDERRKRDMQAELNEEAMMLERMLATVLSAPRPEGPYRAAVPFTSLMGKLQSPVEGVLAAGFGVQTHPRYGTKTLNSGLLIAASAGATVKAVADGKVVFAEQFQSYGLMVIIDHGSPYCSMYTHLRAISVSKDQAVKSGEAIGYVGDTADGPRLGFEIRRRTTSRDTASEDPQKWLASKYGPGR